MCWHHMQFSVPHPRYQLRIIVAIERHNPSSFTAAQLDRRTSSHLQRISVHAVGVVEALHVAGPAAEVRLGRQPAVVDQLDDHHRVGRTAESQLVAVTRRYLKRAQRS